MSKRVFKADLSVSGIQRLKRELQDYKNNILKSKINTFNQRLAERGMAIAQAKIAESPLGKRVTVHIESQTQGDESKTFIVATGETVHSDGYEPFNVLLAIEFGAGIHYNPTSNPYSDEFGYGVGSFPGQIHAFEKGWYYWDANTEEWKFSHGVKATMPMYNADIEMIQSVVSIAKEVFGE